MMIKIVVLIGLLSVMKIGDIAFEERRDDYV